MNRVNCECKMRALFICRGRILALGFHVHRKKILQCRKFIETYLYLNLIMSTIHLPMQSIKI